MSMPTKYEKRESNFAAWIEAFKSYRKTKSGEEILSIEQSEKILNIIYWDFAEKYTRPAVKGVDDSTDKDDELINRFKIISTIQISIVSVLPVYFKSVDLLELVEDFDDEVYKKYRILNAEFAFFVGIQVLNSWFSHLKLDIHLIDKCVDLLDYKDEIIKDSVKNYGEIPTIYSDYINYLTYFERSSSYPTFPISFFWRMLEFIILPKN